MSRKALQPHSSENGDLLPRPQGLGDAVYETVLQKLLAVEIKPEERISIDELARKLGVSQTPIREALTRLETQGLITKTHLVGYRAAPQLSKEQFEQLYETRVLLEPHVAAKAAASIDKNTLNRLEHILDGLLSADVRDANLLVRTAQVDSEFHRTIAAASGNRVIARILDAIQVQVQFTLLRRRVEPINMRPATVEHRRILAALRKRDSKSASVLMRQHLAASRERYWPQPGSTKRVK